jgi:probable F420-dependent oxidoreductase
VKVDGWMSGALAQAGESACRLEQLGFDGAFSSEGPHDSFLPVALAALRTERIRLMTNITVGFARSPLDLAQLANDVQLASGGRFVLGVGSQVRPHIEKRFSMPWSRPVDRMGELVLAVKAIQEAWSTGGRLDFCGEIYRHTLMTPFFSPGPNPFGPPPVHVAGLGPKMTAKAAEVADGLLVHPFNTERFVRDMTAPAVDAGLRRSGRSRQEFTVSVPAIVATGHDEREMSAALEGTRRLLSFYGSTPSYRVVLDAHGEGELQRELNSLSKEGRWDEMVGLIDDAVLRLLAVCGAPREAGDEIVRRYRGVADRVSFSTPYAISEESTLELLEAVRAAAGP